MKPKVIIFNYQFQAPFLFSLNLVKTKQKTNDVFRKAFSALVFYYRFVCSYKIQIENLLQYQLRILNQFFTCCGTKIYTNVYLFINLLCLHTLKFSNHPFVSGVMANLFILLKPGFFRKQG